MLHYYIVKNTLNKFKTYGVFITEEKKEWIPNYKQPIIPKGTEDRIFSLINCGNGTAHQVKLSIVIGEQQYKCEKCSSVQKDDEIYFYFGLKNGIELTEPIILNIRYFDVELIKRNNSMSIKPKV